MERVTFPRKEVQEWLAGLVCVKVDCTAGDHPLMSEFGVRGFPTLILQEPAGKILHRDPGAPAPEQFVDYFAGEAYNAAVEAYNGKKWAEAAPHLFFLDKWFRGTRLGREAEGMREHARKQAGFAEAYEAARKAYEARLEAVREEQQKEEARRDAARKRKEEADALFAKYMRTKAYAVYREIVRDYPDLPEAEAAREVLRKNRQKWEEPGAK
jgi:hypothetical protein